LPKSLDTSPPLSARRMTAGLWIAVLALSRLRFYYRQDGVGGPPAITLQEEAGVDVNLLLFPALAMRREKRTFVCKRDR